MAKDKKSFVAYTDWKQTFDALPDDKAGQLIKHIFSFVADENPETDDILINAVFANIQKTLERDLKKWKKQHSQRKKAGKRSAELRKQQKEQALKASQQESTTVEQPNNEKEQTSTTVERPLQSVQRSSTVNVNVNANVNDSVNVNDNEKDSKEDKKKIDDLLFKQMVDIYFNWMKETLKVTPNFNAVEGKAMKMLIKYFRQVVESDDDVLSSFELILSRWAQLDSFYQKQIKVSQINSNIVNIINQLKNGTEKRPINNNGSGSNGVTQDYAQKLFERLQSYGADA